MSSVMTGGTPLVGYTNMGETHPANVTFGLNNATGELTYEVSDPWQGDGTEFDSGDFGSLPVIAIQGEDFTNHTLDASVVVDPFPSLGDVIAPKGYQVSDVFRILKLAATDMAEYAITGPKATAAADVDGSGTDGFLSNGITAFDAYLDYLQVIGPKAGQDVVAQVGTRVMLETPVRSERTVRLPITLQGDLEDVGSVGITMQLDAALAKVESVQMPEGWLMAYSVSEEGILRIAAIAADAVVPADGSIGTVTVTLATSDTQLMVTGEAQVNGSGIQTLDAVEVVVIPDEFALFGNYPNPFNPTTNVSFDLPQTAQVSIEVYDLVGRRVMVLPTQEIQAGAKRTVQLDGSRLASGSYFYRVIASMESQTVVETGRMMLVK
jgi:hypothetical protein